jgi:hypothetical protein
MPGAFSSGHSFLPHGRDALGETSLRQKSLSTRHWNRSTLFGRLLRSRGWARSDIRYWNRPSSVLRLLCWIGASRIRARWIRIRSRPHHRSAVSNVSCAMVMVPVLASPAFALVIAMFFGLSGRHVVTVPSCFAALVPAFTAMVFMMFVPLACGMVIAIFRHCRRSHC